MAGCYYLSARFVIPWLSEVNHSNYCSVASLLQRTNTFPCTAYIEDCCRSLSADPEYPTDKYLHAIIRLQRAIEEVDMPLMAGFSTTEQAEDLAGVVPRTSPNSIKAQMPFDLKENGKDTPEKNNLF